MNTFQHTLQLAALGVEQDELHAERLADRERIQLGPHAVEVRAVAKSFRIPSKRVETVAERLRHPHQRVEYRELRALREVSFNVHEGEFFGIIGRNGSGKSTLLKILASIYKADHGAIRVAGRLAPFIELGVGFNAELTARENIELNGVMMGIGRREARRRLDAVLEFAELREFVDLKLKNYSSGMMVRLAFSSMLEADADVMLVDEVLAVGDAAFGQKCLDAFRERRAAGKTIVLVSHDMATVQTFCDRTMLLHHGEVRYIGDPGEAALRYYRLNFDQAHDPTAVGMEGSDIELVDVWLEDLAGSRIEDVRQGEGFTFHLTAEAKRSMPAPSVAFELLNVDDVTVLGFGQSIEDDDQEPRPVAAGERIRLSFELGHALVLGRYKVLFSMARSRNRSDDAVRNLRVLDFVVKGEPGAPGMVYVRADVRATVESGESAR